MEVELEPEFTFHGRERKADLRVRRGGGIWTFVEVAQPQRSDEWRGVEGLVSKVVDTVNACQGSFALEVFFHREPTTSEVEALSRRIPEWATNDLRVQQLDQGLATLYWNESAPGEVVIGDHGEPSTPRVAAARLVSGPDARRHIMCRCPFSDDRAVRFLRHEAAQLPSDSPALIMLEVSAVPSAIKKWAKLIPDEFENGRYRWVSGVCLFWSGFTHSDDGEYVKLETLMLEHADANHNLPDWLLDRLYQFGPH